MTWVLVIAGFAALIMLHEGGHFVVAKLTGMRVERFFLFFPPKLVSIKRGETEYGIGMIPLGGFVKITGMNPEELEEARRPPPRPVKRNNSDATRRRACSSGWSRRGRLQPSGRSWART